MPESEIGDLIVEVRSATAGVGSFTFKFDHMQELTGKQGRPDRRGAARRLEHLPEKRAGQPLGGRPRRAAQPRSRPPGAS